MSGNSSARARRGNSYIVNWGLDAPVIYPSGICGPNDYSLAVQWP